MYINFFDITETTCAMRLEGLDESYEKYDREVQWCIGSEAFEQSAGFVNRYNYEFTKMVNLEAHTPIGATVTFFGLSPSTMYHVMCYVDYTSDLDGDEWKTTNTYSEFFTKAEYVDEGFYFNPVIETCVPDKTSCFFVISGADPRYKENDAYLKCVLYEDDNGEPIIIRNDIMVYSQSGKSFVELTIDNLEPNKNYYIRPTFYFTEHGEQKSATYAFGYYAFKTTSVKIPYWSWNTKNQADPVYGGEASSKEVQRAYKAITKVSGYGVNDFSHSVWNDLVEYVRVILEKTKDTWSTYENETGKTYLDRDETLMGNDEYTLTAEKFNALRFNIGSRVSTGITDRKKGDVVYGDYFITLTECINRWISEKL